MIVLEILKIIGIVVLSVVGLLLFLLLLLLFWPFFYQIEANKEESCQGTVKLSWLFHLITLRLSYEKSVQLVLRVLGIPVYSLGRKKEEKSGPDYGYEADAASKAELTAADNAGTENTSDCTSGYHPVTGENLHPEAEPKEASHPDAADQECAEKSPAFADANAGNKEQTKKEQAKKEQANKDQANKDQANKDQANKDQANKDQANKDQANKDQANKVPTNKDQANKDQANKDQANKAKSGGRWKHFLDKLSRFWQRLLTYLEELPEKLEHLQDTFSRKLQSVFDTMEYYDTLRNKPGTKKVLEFLKKEITVLLRHLKPYKASIRLEYQSDDPESCAKLIELYAIARLLLPKKTTVQASLDEETKLEFAVRMKGRFYLSFLGFHGLRILLNKKVKRFIRLVKREE